MAPDNASYGSLGEQTKLINMALKHTGGNAEKAKMMVVGQYDDVIVIKGKFSAEQKNVSGVFLVFLNNELRYLMNINTLILPSIADSEKARIFDNWKLFYKDFLQMVQREGERAVGSYDFTNHFADSLEGYNIYDYVASYNLEGTTETIREIIKKFYGVDKVQCKIEFDKTSSIAVELEGIPIEIPAERASATGETEEKSEFDKRLENIEKQASYIIEGKIIVSPIRGKSINDVKPGDNIKVLLKNQDEVSRSVAKLMNAMSPEGAYMPIKGRIKDMVPLDKSGFIIYALVAKNVLVKIVEEENVKIEMDSLVTQEKSDKGDSRLILYVALLLGLILFSLIIIIALI